MQYSLGTWKLGTLLTPLSCLDKKEEPQTQNINRIIETDSSLSSKIKSFFSAWFTLKMATMARLGQAEAGVRKYGWLSYTGHRPKALAHPALLFQAC